MPLRRLREAGYEPVAWYGNPNIEPAEEYERRRTGFRDFAEDTGLAVIEGSYDPEAFHAAIAGNEGIFPCVEGVSESLEMREQRQERCRRCYRLRFTRLAQTAREQGIRAIATSLSVSPWQFTEVIAEELECAATSLGLVSLFVDYRADYPEATRLSRERGMYRQNYCGCASSRREAELERAARRAARREERHVEHGATETEGTVSRTSALNPQGTRDADG
jgi:predicted adenine nucleotide alpha hydrolase (AANH) superfamily ATPase